MKSNIESVEFISSELEKIGLEFSSESANKIPAMIGQLTPTGMKIYSLLGANRLLKIYEARHELHEFALLLRKALDDAWDAIHENDDLKLNSIAEKILTIPDLYDDGDSKYGMEHEPCAASIYALDSLRGNEQKHAMAVWNQAGEYSHVIAATDIEFQKKFPDGTTQLVMENCHPAFSDSIDWHYQVVSFLKNKQDKLVRHHPFWTKPVAYLN